MLTAELSEIAEGLDLANATKVRLPGGPTVEVVITHVQPTIVEEAVKDGFFDPPQAERALRLAANIRSYNAKVSYLLSILSSATVHESTSEQLAHHAIEEIQATRQAIVADARLLAKPK